MKDRPKKGKSWEYSGEYIEACNCNYGCPCNFNAPSTYGYCEGTGAVNITKGKFLESVKLDGLKFAFAISLPGLVHEGHGTGRLYIDELASEDQKDALRQILTGKAATGLPWSIFSALIDKWLEPRFVKFEWEFDGPNNSYFKAGGYLHAIAEPIRNPVTGEDSFAKITLPNGLVWNEAEMGTTKSFAVFDEDLKFAHPGKYLSLSKVHHHS